MAAGAQALSTLFWVHDSHLWGQMTTSGTSQGLWVVANTLWWVQHTAPAPAHPLAFSPGIPCVPVGHLCCGHRVVLPVSSPHSTQPSVPLLFVPLLPPAPSLNSGTFAIACFSALNNFPLLLLTQLVPTGCSEAWRLRVWALGPDCLVQIRSIMW